MGRTSLELYIRPPARELRDADLYEVPAEVVAQARPLGLKGNVAAQIKRMVGEADLGTDGRGNLKTHQYLLRIERGVVTWIGETDAQRRHRRGKRSA